MYFLTLLAFVLYSNGEHLLYYLPTFLTVNDILSFMHEAPFAALIRTSMPQGGGEQRYDLILLRCDTNGEEEGCETKES